MQGQANYGLLKVFMLPAKINSCTLVIWREKILGLVTYGH